MMNDATDNDTAPLPFARRLGIRLRLVRRACKLTQAAMAEATGMTPRRISLCEQGESHITAGEIYTVARRLNVPVMFFFNTDPVQDEVDMRLAGDPELRLEVEKFIRVFRAVRSPDLREELRALLETTANSPSLNDRKG